MAESSHVLDSISNPFRVSEGQQYSQDVVPFCGCCPDDGVGGAAVWGPAEAPLGVHRPVSWQTGGSLGALR